MSAHTMRSIAHDNRHPGRQRRCRVHQSPHRTRSGMAYLGRRRARAIGDRRRLVAVLPRPPASRAQGQRPYPADDACGQRGPSPTKVDLRPAAAGSTVRGHLHGVPFSGKPLDAFPSGHAMHVGALVSTATVLPRAKRNLVLAFGAGLVLTRIVLLAHWVSDVAAGLALGALAERLLRPLTGYDVRGRTENPSAVEGRGGSSGNSTEQWSLPMRKPPRRS